MEDALLSLAVVGYLLAGFVWPTLDVWRRHRVWPVVFDREAAPAQRVLGLATRALLLVVVALTVARWVGGREALAIRESPFWLRAVGWLLVAVGALLTVTAQRQMGASWRVGIDDRRTALVISGLFRWARNPIFSGLLLFLAGYAALSLAWWSVALWVATAVGVRVQVAYEEQHLIRLHGEAYRAYAGRVGRFEPFLGRLR